MEDHNYSKRELDEHFKIVNDKLDGIIFEAKKTNGRIGKLENWRTGITYVIVFAGAIVIPLAVYAFNLAIQK